MATIEQEPVTTPESEAESLPTAKLDPKWAMGFPHVLVVALFGVLFMVLNYIPIRGTDIWGHIGYGHWILEHQELPTEDPWMPLSVGMQVIDSAWLSQVIFASLDQGLGPSAVSHLFAIAGIAAFLIWARVFYLQTGRLSLMACCTVMLVVLGWSRLATVRPESLAIVCFAGLFWLLIGSGLAPPGRETLEDADDDYRLPLWMWFAVPGLFVLWANLHGSFVLGLAIIACFFVGRLVEIAWRKRDFYAVVTDARLRYWLYLGELAFAATLINPYGLDLLVYSAMFAGNENLLTVLEWQPLVILSVGGREFALSVVLLMIALRYSRRPIPAAHVLLLALFALATVKSIRMIGWYAPLYCFVVAPHLADILNRFAPARVLPPAVLDEHGDVVSLPPGRSFRYSMICLLLIWITFALSPVSRMVFGRSPRTDEQLYMEDTPLRLSAWLRDNQPKGQVFHPQHWGDWLKRDGPASFQAFVTTNIHLAPRQVWRDYNRAVNVNAGWERVLERYDVEMVIVDRTYQDAFLRAMLRSNDWQTVYEDDQAAVFTPVSGAPAARPAQPQEDGLASR